MGRVTLNVSSIGRSLQLYRDVLGFHLLTRDPNRALLGTEDQLPILELIELPEAQPRPPGTTGLFHFAVLVPTRSDLGRLLGRIRKAGISIGQSDHLVSESLYLADPDGIGIELYRDRPRDEWKWDGNRVTMASEPLNLRSLLEDGAADPRTWNGLPAGTTVGHIHLNVGDLTVARHFYGDILGFDLTSRFPGALFMSAGGYHHHLGLNTWESSGGAPAPDGAVGMRSYTIAFSSRAAREQTEDRLRENGVAVEVADDAHEVLDPWRNRIRLVTPQPDALEEI